MSKNIEDIEGIGPVLGAKLRDAGATTVEKLLEVGGTKKGRVTLAETSGVAESKILKFVNMADLFRINGVGEEFSELLEASGVDSVVELATRNAENLTKKMAEVNETKKLTRALPSLVQVEKWVAQAKDLPRAVHH